MMGEIQFEEMAIVSRISEQTAQLSKFQVFISYPPPGCYEAVFAYSLLDGYFDLTTLLSCYPVFKIPFQDAFEGTITNGNYLLPVNYVSVSMLKEKECGA